MHPYGPVQLHTDAWHGCMARFPTHPLAGPRARRACCRRARASRCAAACRSKSPLRRHRCRRRWVAKRGEAELLLGGASGGAHPHPRAALHCTAGPARPARPALCFGASCRDEVFARARTPWLLRLECGRGGDRRSVHPLECGHDVGRLLVCAHALPLRKLLELPPRQRRELPRGRARGELSISRGARRLAVDTQSSTVTRRPAAWVGGVATAHT